MAPLLAAFLNTLFIMFSIVCIYRYIYRTARGLYTRELSLSGDFRLDKIRKWEKYKMRQKLKRKLCIKELKTLSAERKTLAIINFMWRVHCVREKNRMRGRQRGRERERQRDLPVGD